MKIYIPSKTYTGKPIAYFEDGEKEIMDKLIDLEENYYVEDGVLFSKHSNNTSAYPGNLRLVKGAQHEV